MYFIWEFTAYFSTLLFNWVVFLVFNFWVSCVLLSLILTQGFSYHSTVCLLSWLTVLFRVQKLCDLMQLHLLIGVLFPEQPESCPGILTRPICWQALLALPSRSFRVLGLTLKSLVHLELVVCKMTKTPFLYIESPRLPNSIGSRCHLLLSVCFHHLCQN